MKTLAFTVEFGEHQKEGIQRVQENNVIGLSL